MKPIRVYQNAGDPYWQMLKEGAESSVDQLYIDFFLMQKRLRAITGNTILRERKIIVKSINGFRG